MNRFILLITLAALTLPACYRDRPQPADYYACAQPLPVQDDDHPLADPLRDWLQQRVAQGLPGVSLTVRHPEYGTWSGAAGWAEIVGRVPYVPCHFSRVGSTVKTFTAVALLMLAERGQVELDAPADTYLPAETLAGIENAAGATVRQLLQHAAGVDNYIRNLQFQTASLNDFTRVWQPEELLQYSRGAAATFPVGEDVAYSNTGYILLGMIIEAVTGEPFYRFFEREIFVPLGMQYTRFAAPDPVPAGIVRGYIDMYDNGELIDATDYSGWDYFTADGGLLSNPYDLTLFLEALFEGRLLAPETLTAMLDVRYPRQSEDGGYLTGFGLGIFAVDTEYGVAYLHSGDAVGYFATMVHFPSQKVTVAWAANGNYGSLDELTQTKEVMDGVFKLIVE